MVRKITKAEAQKAFSGPSGPPAPFKKAPSHLKPFLDTLDPSQVYITHIDRFPWDFKRRIFAVPVALNVTIVALLLWRAYYAIPTYLEIFSAFIGEKSSATIVMDDYTTRQLVWIWLKRSAMFIADFFLVRVTGPWPLTFFLEQPANPVSWRWAVGFRDTEIVVRESRKWGAEELLQGVKKGQDSPFFKTRVLTGIDRQYMREKTGYLMMGKDWDIDCAAMIVAHRLVDAKRLALADFEKTVLAHLEGVGWLAWQVWKLDQVGDEEEQRKKIVALKDRLTALGKESLFFRWIEIVQYESNQPGEFTPQRQKATLEKIKQAFDEQGVDFDRLVADVGGLDGAPGMTATT